ncbi:MAG: hydrogenase maturation protease [Bacteroidetes bacterium]|jgi:hydrogenase maturation protease|nr:hydrogenase maturation protease [Bacteroidota bacterium]MBT5528205.1 hydrogenase maturation protease [Cytophagia bacterium]MBT3422966.1 hydrogenase maturation protease [Bacteroidota bacterium]MBT3801685.1 hydrogenase maturation protease [Bacteroidota bacterium]MBT3934212.1 hydrogenase maturation protease [Bacteroidota bacterium]
MSELLIYGYGNPGRQDDGLGNSFIEELDKWVEANKLSHISTDSNYQLNIEDADAIKDKQVVLFVDASIEEIDDFCISRVESSDSTIEFTMHAVSTSFVLDLCQKVYNKSPKTYLLHLKGYEWDFAEGLTDKAKANMDKALRLIQTVIQENDTNKICSELDKLIAEKPCP